MKTKPIYGWHFCNETLRDGSPIPKDGAWLKHTGDVKICGSGLHFSDTPFEALEYAPGATLCYVELRGVVGRQGDKGVARERRIISRMDATELLRYFARMQALSVVHLWNAPEVVLDYLMTGDEEIMVASRNAARDASWAASWDASRAASRDASRDASWAASWAASRAASSAASSAASWDASSAASWDASSAASWAASWDASRAASSAACRDEFNALFYECFGLNEEGK